MSDNDLIRRGDVAGALMKAWGQAIRARDVGYKHGAKDAFDAGKEAAEAIRNIPAVPQEMSAREYIATLNRICGRHYVDCMRCPLETENNGQRKPCSILQKENPEVSIAIVEQWAKEHPEKKRKTYAEDFKEHFGRSWNNKDNNWQCRGKLYNDNADCVNSPRCDCEACWNEEMEEQDEMQGNKM